VIDCNIINRAIIALLTGLVLLLSGCATTSPAPVEDRSLGAHHGSRRSVPMPADGSVYRVRRGDTLYSIAFRNGLDYRELARENRIDAPYTIYPGQEIRLDGRPPVRRGSASTPQPVTRAASVASRPSPPPALVESKPAAARPAPSVAKPADAAATPAVPPRAPAIEANSAAADMVWRWPAEGQLVASFVNGDQTRQGINIAGKSGDPVRATADGEVVYSGDGLIGYGELIIVKHNSTLLSAYGHNRRRLVKEGDKVKSGQQIAEMGSSSATRDMLHFEIRRNGKPVDPLGFLPRR